MQSKLIILFFSIFFLCQQRTIAQNEKLPSTFFVGIDQDNVFGFYPSAFGSFGINDKVSFAYYGIMWANSSWGNSNGTDLLLEVGAGVSYPYENWLFNVYLGFTNGKLYSPNLTGQIGESLVPNFSAYYFSDEFDVEVFGAYYKGTRSNFSINSAEFWVYGGYKFNDHVIVGLHYENLSEKNTALYRHLGPFVKFTIDDKYSFRFVAGKNFKDRVSSDEYYKLSVGLILK